MSVGVRMFACVIAYGIVSWLVILGLAAGDPWMVGLSAGWFLPVIPLAIRKWASIGFTGFILAAGIFGPAWALMGVLLFVPLYLEIPRPGLIFGLAMTGVLLGLSLQEREEIREREEILRELVAQDSEP